MDRIELRRTLFKKPKRELIDFIGTVSEKCPHFKTPSDIEKATPDIIAAQLLSILLKLELDYPEEKSICVDILSKEGIEIKSKEKTIFEEELSKTTKFIPFNPNEVCVYLFQLINADQEFIKCWNESRISSGFITLLHINGIGLPSDMEELLFKKIFNSPQLNYDDDLLIKYARFQLDNWENELKLVISELTPEEVEIILSLNLVFQGISSILEKSNVKINYNFDDIPLLKRVILSQYTKLLKNGLCTDKELDELAVKINDIIYNRDIESNIKLLPWSDLE